MRVAERPYAAAAAALLAAGAVAVAPVVSQPAGTHSANAVIRLVADDSLLNIPVNLFYDILNIPYNEVEAVDFITRSLFFSGPWFVVSPTNLWGVDPGDPSHFQAVMNFLVPFPALSGMDAPETDFGAGMGQQLWGMMAAMLPTSSGCDVDTCAPVVPESPITGVTADDFFLWLSKILSGQEKFPIFDNWFKVPVEQLFNGYYFDPGFGGSTDPSGPAYPGFGFDGTTTVSGPDGQVHADAMPWSGATYTLNSGQPAENFFNSLVATPATDGFLGTGIYLPSFEEIGRILQAFAASVVLAFDPFTPGSPFCPGDCSIITNLHLDYPDIVKFIGAVWPGNPLIEEWLTAYANGTANVPTADGILSSIKILQQGFWDFGNPPEPDGYNLSGPDYGSWAPFFYQLWTALGFSVPPPYGGEADAAVSTIFSDLTSEPGAFGTDLSTVLADVGL